MLILLRQQLLGALIHPSPPVASPATVSSL
ncbi:hypothetical protein FHS34_004640 [Streptomyces echinatus]|uniref:Uncharacterized protein n=1 Tax=Streptomyces echinatus TaxID=67293 RepID=A0A7W9PWE0_9ACTN|nr:hypothetical protein [Streptomyces echinatus]